MKYTYEPFKRSFWKTSDDDIEGDIVITKKQHKYNILENLHESILTNINLYISWEDMSALKIISKQMNNVITAKDIVNNSIQNSSLLTTFCTLVVNEKTTYLRTLLDTNRIPMAHIRSALMFSTATFYNESAKILCDYVEFSKQYSGEHNNPILKQYDCRCAICLEKEITIDRLCNEHEDEHYFPQLSKGKLLFIAISSDNIDMFRYIKNKYNMKITNIDVWVMMQYKSLRVFQDMLRESSRPEIISQKMMIGYLRVFEIEDNVSFIALMFESGVIKLGRKLLTVLIALIDINYLNQKDIRIILKIIETHASHHMIQYVFKQFIRKNRKLLLKEFINISPRIVYKQKHLDMVKKYKNNDEIEYIIANKLVLQYRRTL